MMERKGDLLWDQEAQFVRVIHQLDGIMIFQQDHVAIVIGIMADVGHQNAVMMIHQDLLDTMTIMIQRLQMKEDTEHILHDQQGRKVEVIEGEEIHKEMIVKKRKVQDHVQARADHMLDRIGEQEEIRQKKIHILHPNGHANEQQRMTVICSHLHASQEEEEDRRQPTFIEIL